MLTQKIRFIIFIGAIISTFGAMSGTKVYAVDDYVCPQPKTPGMVAICGTIKQAFPKDGGKDNKLKMTGKGIGGASVYLYEYDPNSDTGKKAGSFVHYFSATSTTENDSEGYDGGRFRIESRARGGLNTRFLILNCSGKTAGIWQISSYQAIPNFIDYVDCPETNVYSPPPDVYTYIDRSGNSLACDQKKEDTNKVPLTYEVINSKAKKTTSNFYIKVSNFDSRFAPLSAPDSGMGNADLITTAIGLFAEATKQNKDGAWWSKDCLNQTNDSLCLKIVQAGQTPQDYEKFLYTNEDALQRLFIPVIPPTNAILPYRALVAQQNVTEYIQSPTAGAQFLHTEFGNCIGQVFLRNYKQTLTDDYISCGEFKKCNSLISTDKNNIKSAQTTSGPAKSLMLPYTIDTATYLKNIDPTVVACKLNGKEITVHEIFTQPAYKEYANPELLLYYGGNGATGVIPNKFQASNDSFYPAKARETQIKPMDEGNLAPLGGTNVVFPNGGNNPNNSVVAATTVASTFSNVYGLPYEKEDNYFSGIKVVDKGENGKVFCLDANTNKENTTLVNEVNAANEASLVLNNEFKGNTSHYNIGAQTDGPLARDSSTATSAEFLSSPAKKRQELLVNNNNKIPDLVDGLADIGSGNGKVVMSLSSLWDTFRKTFGGTSPYKVLIDRKNNPGTPDVRDDMRVTFPLSEENFEDAFPLPAGETLVTGEWGADTCYPWKSLGLGASCNTFKEQKTLTADPTLKPLLSRTCRVESCIVFKKVKTNICSGLIGRTACTQVGNTTTKTTPTQTECTLTDRMGIAVSQQTLAQYNETTHKWEYNLNEISKKISVGDPDACAFDAQGDCHNQSSSKTKAFGQVGRAGPYMCVGTLAKDANMDITQGSLDANKPQVDANPISLADNKAPTTWSMPFTTKYNFSKGAELSSATSVLEDNALNDNTKGKDTLGIGGGSKPTVMQQVAMPVNFEVGPINYPLIDYGCNSTELSSTGSWNCPVSPLPKDVDIDKLQVDDACTLNVSSNCLSSLGVASLSATFTKVVNAAATANKLPAAAIVTYMRRANRVAGFYAEFSPENNLTLKVNSSKATGRMATCDERDSGFEGPYDWLTPYFYQNLQEGAATQINILPAIGGGTSAGRGDTDPEIPGGFYASKCNFLDSTYAVAKALAKGVTACNTTTYSGIVNNLMDLSWGTDRVGAYTTDSYYQTGPGKEVFIACGGSSN